MGTSTVFAFAILSMAAFAAAGCQHAGSGTLGYVPSTFHLSARTGPVVFIDVYRPEPGDAVIPEGKLAFHLRAEGFPEINCGVQCTYLVLRRLSTASQPAEGPPAAFRTCEELSAVSQPQIPRDQPGLQEVGRVEIGDDHAIGEVLLVEDTPENWNATWVLTDEGLGGYIAIRCGKVVVTPP
jgi:hypothetical protein